MMTDFIGGGCTFFYLLSEKNMQYVKYLCQTIQLSNQIYVFYSNFTVVTKITSS